MYQSKNLRDFFWRKNFYGGYKEDWYDIINLAQFCQFPRSLWKYTCEMDKC